MTERRALRLLEDLAQLALIGWMVTCTPIACGGGGGTGNSSATVQVTFSP